MTGSVVASPLRNTKTLLRSSIFERGLKDSGNTEIGGKMNNSIQGLSWEMFCAFPEYDANINFVYKFYANSLDKE